ncbi:exodeoxyribonuclease VII large subunit [Pseudochelatococcus lubricantis]|uniref:exodeoxyribonuclease VII large subunit n=1 Tax=Pseudochelatococcus lubricantis TaxID=1538102 RepID=UPI0035E71274
MSILPSLLNSPTPWPRVDEPVPVADTVGSDPPAVLPLHRLLSLMDGAIRAVTADWTAGVWITGEVTKVNARHHGWFAELVDPLPGKSHSACLGVRIGPQVVEETSLATGIAVTPDLIEGQAVTMRVRLRLDLRHQLTAQVLEIDPLMTPSLRAAAAAKLLGELREGGLHDLQRNLPTPRDVLHLALVCPDASAARGDVDAVLTPFIARRLLVMDTHTIRFEGPAAAGDLVETLGIIARQTWRPRADAVLIVRGGGSAVGLASIETRAVAEHIARMPMPVVLGIGHAADRGILSEIAWKSCTTPTSAATAVRDLIVGAAMTAHDNAATIAALCRERIAMQETACRSVTDVIRHATFRALNEQTKLLADRDHGIETAIARLDEKLVALDADIDRMVAGMHAQVSGTNTVFDRHLEDLDRMSRTARGRGAMLTMTAERDVASRAAELAQARLSLSQPPVPHVSPMAEAAPVVVRAPDGTIVMSACRARDRPLTLQFHDGAVPVVPHRAAITRSVTDVPAS